MKKNSKVVPTLPVHECSFDQTAKVFVIPHEILMQVTTLAKEAKGTYPAAFIMLNDKTNRARTFVLSRTLDIAPIYTTPLADVDNGVQLMAVTDADAPKSQHYQRRIQPIAGWDEDRINKDEKVYEGLCAYAHIMGNRWEREHEDRGGMPVKMVS